MNWKDNALVHAKDQDPKEAVGLVLNIKGKERYFPCRNLSITANQCFILDPEDYLKQRNLEILLEFFIAILCPHHNLHKQIKLVMNKVICLGI